MTENLSPAEEAAMRKAVSDLIAKIEGLVTKLGQLVHEGLQWLAPHAADLAVAVAGKWKAFVTALDRFWEEVTVTLKLVYAPSHLLALRTAWTQQVGRPVSGEVQTAELKSLLVDNYFVGTAATGYKDMLSMQKAALEKVKANFVDGVAPALTEMVKAVKAYWVTVFAAFAAFAASLVGALTASSTVFGIPAGLAWGYVGLTAAIATLTGAGLTLSGAEDGVVTTLQLKLDYTAYKDGRWPAVPTLPFGPVTPA